MHKELGGGAWEHLHVDCLLSQVEFHLTVIHFKVQYTSHGSIKQMNTDINEVMIRQIFPITDRQLYTQSSHVQLWWCGLPVCLSCTLVEDVVMAINVHHSVLQEKLPPILDTTYLCVCVRVCVCVCVHSATNINNTRPQALHL